MDFDPVSYPLRNPQTRPLKINAPVIKSTPNPHFLTDHFQGRHPLPPQEVLGQKRDFQNVETKKVELTVEDENLLACASSRGGYDVNDEYRHCGWDEWYGREWGKSEFRNLEFESELNKDRRIGLLIRSGGHECNIR